MIGPEKFLELLDSDSKQVAQQFIIGRHVELTDSSTEMTFPGAGDRYTFNYIHPGSVIRIKAFSKGFRVNDPDLLTTFVSATQRVVRTSSEELSADDLVLRGVQLATTAYFGPLSNEAARKKLQGGLLRGKVRDLSEIRVSESAMCVERASVSHNLCLLGGIASAYVTGRMSVDADKPNGHAFQLVRRDTDVALFDVSHPSITIDGEDCDIKPTVIPLGSEIEQFITGKPVSATINSFFDGDQTSYQADYSQDIAYPPTVEEFCALTRGERMALSEQPYEVMKREAIIGAARALLASQIFRPV